jgi:antitoxin component of MazEF toxin-antitoxin module
MVKTLTAHGNSSALLIDKPILDLLKITPETPLEISTDGKRLIISPITEGMENSRSAKIQKALEKVNKKHGKALKDLAK